MTIRGPVKLAVVGCGYWGRVLLSCLARIPEARVVCCCDVSPRALEAARQLAPGARTVTDYRQAAEAGIDAVLVVTPASTHFEIATHFLQAGIGAFVEKPLCTSSEQVETLGKLAQQRGALLTVGHQYHFNALVTELAARVRAGRIGALRELRSSRAHHGMIKQDVNAVWDLAPHDIGIVRALAGEAPCEVQALPLSLEGDGRVDAARILLRHPGGLVARIYVSWSHPSKVRSFVAIGNDGRALLDEVGAPGRLAFTGSGRQGLRQELELNSPQPVELELRHFIECIRTRKVPRIGWMDCLEIVRVLEALDRSIEAGGSPVAVEGPRQEAVRVSA